MTDPRECAEEPLLPQVLQSASEWFALLSSDDCSEAQKRAWRQWRDAHPQHERAWQRVEQVQRHFGKLNPPAAAAALGRPLPRRRKVVQGLALVTVGLGTSWLAQQLLPWRAWSADIQTATGEQRELTLPDGTQLTLNTATAVNVHYDEQARRVELVQGEIQVRTAVDRQSRRFELLTRFGRLVPVGTRFTVRQQDDWARLTVFEGAVRIEGTGVARTAPAGTTVHMDAHGAGRPEPSADRADAWTEGVLLADGMPLGELVAELSRYRRGYLGCDPAVAPLRLSGTFPLNDPDQTLNAVMRALPVRAVERTALWVRLVPLQ